MKRQTLGMFAIALVVIVALPLLGLLEVSGGGGQGRVPERPTPIPSTPMRILPGAVDAPILNHTAIRLGPHDPADILSLTIVAGHRTPEATTAITRWARGAGLTVRYVTSDCFLMGVTAPTARIEKALSVTIKDYRLPGGYRFWANDRGPSIPTSLSINAIVGLSTYTQASLPGPLVAATPTP